MSAALKLPAEWGAHDRRPLIVHVIYRLAIGGLENGLVNLLNHWPHERHRHCIVCLSDHTDFRRRIERKDIPVLALHKRPGKDLANYWRLYRLLRRLRPDIVHTRNLGTLDALYPAWLAGVRVRVHGLHGWDVVDLHGENRRYRILQKLCSPLVSRYVAVSRDLAEWLIRAIGVRSERVTHICNGVDVERYRPADARQALPAARFADPDAVVVGTVGRLEAVKDPLHLVEAFLQLRRSSAQAGRRLRLALIGDGALRGQIERRIAQEGAGDDVWLAGAREDIPELLRALDIFVLPSLNEGISNTILEAMASGLPVIATRVGGNAELVDDGETGTLVPPGAPAELAAALGRYVDDPALMRRHARAARLRAERRFSLQGMVDGYVALYEDLLQRPRGALRGNTRTPGCVE